MNKRIPKGQDLWGGWIACERDSADQCTHTDIPVTLV